MRQTVSMCECVGISFRGCQEACDLIGGSG